MCLYIALTDTYLVCLLFQRIDSPTFHYSGFVFQLLHSVLEDDVFVYKITKDNFSMKVFVFGIDVSTRCGPLSNVDFTHFVWQNFERISSKQYAITLIPSDIVSFSTPSSLIELTSLSTPRLLSLKYYRATSDGWKDASNCYICVELYQACVSTQCGCILPETCFCKICLRQPLHSLVRRYTYTPKWSTISPISN